MNTTAAFQNVRQALATIKALQPETGRAYNYGTSLTVRQLDGSAIRYQFQHVAGGTMRVVRTELEGLETANQFITPLNTDMAARDYIRAMVVEVLR